MQAASSCCKTAPSPGTPLADVLPLVEEILEVEVTGNRPDLLSVYGMAREIAALYELELAPPPGAPELAGRRAVQVEIEDLEGCPRYDRPALPRRADRPVAALAARAPPGGRGARDLERRGRDELRDARARQPAARLRRASARRGADRRTPARGRASSSRPSTATRRKLDPTDLLIADALAPGRLRGDHGRARDRGRRGRRPTCCSRPRTSSRSAILESSERLGLRTEGSNRWEKGVDPYLAEPAAALATQLIVELTGARSSRAESTSW